MFREVNKAYHDHHLITITIVFEHQADRDDDVDPSLVHSVWNSVSYSDERCSGPKDEG